MKYSTRLSDGVHILILIALGEGDLSSAGIAKSVATNPAYIRRLMAQLKKGGILKTVRGKAEPRLAHAPEQITLLDVYRVMEAGVPLLHLDTHTNPECRAGVYIQRALQDHYDALQEKMEAEMAQITLADIERDFRKKLENSCNT